jgi:hypothetical protein
MQAMVCKACTWLWQEQQHQQVLFLQGVLWSLGMAMVQDMASSNSSNSTSGRLISCLQLLLQQQQQQQSSTWLQENPSTMPAKGCLSAARQAPHSCSSCMMNLKTWPVSWCSWMKWMPLKQQQQLLVVLLLQLLLLTLQGATEQGLQWNWPQ